MNNFTFCTPTNYVFGRDTEQQVGKLTTAMGCSNILIVYGSHSAVASGLIGRVRQSLTEAGVKFTELAGIKPNPTDDRVYEGIGMVRELAIDGLIAVGGGSVIDTAKSIACGSLYEGDFWDFYTGKATVRQALPIGVVLTIPAAGSEGSGNAVITKTETLSKLSLRTDTLLRPKFAIMNPELTESLPAYQTACGITDMFAHIMERYFTPTDNVQVTDGISEGLMRAIITEAEKVTRDPHDYQARANIMWAGTLAHNGICGCGRTEDWVSHFMEHEISAVYNVAHGAGLAVVFPAWLKFMSEIAPERPAMLARHVFGVKEENDKTAALEGVSAMKSFFASIGMPVSFTELGIENPDIDLLVEKLHQNKGAEIGGYRRLDRKATRDIYELML